MGENHSIVYPIQDAFKPEHLGETHISKYIINEYLPYFGVQSFFKEEHYIETSKAAAINKANVIKQNGGGPTRVIKSGTKYIVYEKAYKR